jgi:hypothetical protein
MILGFYVIVPSLEVIMIGVTFNGIGERQAKISSATGSIILKVFFERLYGFVVFSFFEAFKPFYRGLRKNSNGK